MFSRTIQVTFFGALVVSGLGCSNANSTSSQFADMPSYGINVDSKGRQTFVMDPRVVKVQAQVYSRPLNRPEDLANIGIDPNGVNAAAYGQTMQGAGKTVSALSPLANVLMQQYNVKPEHQGVYYQFLDKEGNAVPIAVPDFQNGKAVAPQGQPQTQSGYIGGYVSNTNGVDNSADFNPQSYEYNLLRQQGKLDQSKVFTVTPKQFSQQLFPKDVANYKENGERYQAVGHNCQTATNNEIVPELKKLSAETTAEAAVIERVPGEVGGGSVGEETPASPMTAGVVQSNEMASAE